MTKLVILKLNGNFSSGFQVSLEISEEGQPVERGFSGNLPANIKLSHTLTIWQQQYTALDDNSRLKPQQIIYDGSVNSQTKLISSAKKLEDEFQQWLNSPSFSCVDKHLREELNHSETIRLLICCDRPEVYQLPWCCWDLLENYPNLEIAISNFNFKRTGQKPRRRTNSKVRILAILGDSQGINLNADCNFLKSLEGGEVIFLKQPTRKQLHSYLWEKTWDIIFFAGHSKTVAGQGYIYLNPEDRLNIDELKHGFRKAIANGLQLAIFNSCDGLGIAKELGKLFLPQSIVMRMPIPDIMAQEFIQYFLRAYAEGNSLYLATKMARQQLEAREKQYPCSSWLPIIYQNQAISPPNWADLSRKSQGIPFLPQLSLKRFPLPGRFLASAIALFLVCLIQSWGWLEAGELNVYDRLIAYRATPNRDQRVLVITIDDQDIKYQEQQGMATNMRGSLSDQALQQLLTKLQSGKAKAIGNDVIHDFPFEPALASNIAQTDNFFGICRIKINQPKLISISSAPSLPTDQVGFSNWAIDDDGAIRRQVLGMSPDNICQSSVSLSLRLAIKYLDDIPIRYEQSKTLQIGDTEFPRLKASSGGYHLPEAQGYQILLNYRRALPETITLRDALTIQQSSLNKLVEDKIILIGVVGYNQDLHYTPYSKGKQSRRLPGVIIHAQMTSHIISSVLGEQKPLLWFGDRVEFLWIAFWCGIGSMIPTLERNSFLNICWRITLALAIIFGCSWLMFWGGYWLIAIAPCLGLMLSAAMSATYRKA